MAITTPAGLAVTKKGAMLAPPMAKQPLQDILENVNYIWQKHQPPLLSVVYNGASAVTRSTIYHIPIMPSADGLLYKFEHRFICSSAAQTVAVTVEECDTYAGAGTAWTAIYTQNVVSAGAGALTTSVSAAYVIPADAVAIRVTYAAPGAGNKTDHHLLVYPAPNAPTASVYASGYKPFDDGILTHADGGPIHEEWIQRAAISARAVVEDRRQCAFAFVQEYRSSPEFSCTDAVYGSADAGYAFPKVRAYLPGASGSQSMYFRAIGEVTAGSNTGCIRIGGVQLDADGAINGDTATVNPADSGFGAHVDLALAVANTATNTTRVFAVVAFWTPPQPQDNILSWQAAKWPTAQAYLLGTAAKRVESAALGPYVGTAHIYNGVGSGLSTRYLAAMVPPASLKARLAVAQAWDPSTDSTAVASSVTTGTTAGAVTVVLPWQGSGFDGAFGSVPVKSALVLSSNGDASSSGDCTLSLTQANAPAVEPLQVTNSVGFSLYVSRRLEDLETL